MKKLDRYTLKWYAELDNKRVDLERAHARLDEALNLVTDCPISQTELNLALNGVSLELQNTKEFLCNKTISTILK